MTDFPNEQGDWRVTDGPAIGRAPLFDLSEIRLRADFHASGAMSRSIMADLSSTSPMWLERMECHLAELPGYLEVFEALPEKSYPGLYPDLFESIALDGQRGALAAVAPDHYAIHLYLPPDQFAAILPLVGTAQRRARLLIDIDRTIDQGLPDEECHFWNDWLSPVVLFNEFSLVSPPPPPRLP